VTERAKTAQTPDVGAQPARASESPFHAIFVAEASYVARSLRRLGVPDRDLEDLTHDVFLVAYRHFDDYDPARPLKPWLFGIAVRVAIAYRRRARHQRELLEPLPELVDERPSADEQLGERQARALVLRALESLDADRRPVFVMHDLDGYAMPEIVETLGIPLNTGYSRLRLARQDFAAAVERLRRGSP
jgi:RNA polymerase sigma-70 factor (ECF subfamily)